MDDAENKPPVSLNLKPVNLPKPRAPCVPCLPIGAGGGGLPQISIDWCLKGSVTFSTRSPLSSLKTRSQNRLADCPAYDAITESLSYYRFPFPSVPDAQMRKIAGALTKPGGPTVESEFYERLVGSWRKAFLSLYDGLKSLRGRSFYYFQHDFSAVFRHSMEGEVDVLVCECAEGVRKALEREGIEIEATTAILVDKPDAGEANEPDEPIGLDEAVESAGSIDSDDMSEADHDAIRAEITERIKKRKLKKIQRRSQQNWTVRIRQVHEFVDFLINQRNGRSFVILPELIACYPFLHGTLCRNEMLVHGPDGQQVSRVKLSGALLPEAVYRVRMALHGLVSDDLRLASEPDLRTTALKTFPFQPI